MPDRAAIRAKVEGITKVLTIPATFSRIMSLVNSGNVSAAEIAEEVKKDPALAAKVLKLVNSGFYGFRQPITTITHAMVLLGLDVMKTVVMTASVVDIFDKRNSYMEGLWRHSLATAKAASALAERMRAPSPEEFGLVGLLHDIGKVIVAQMFTAEQKAITQLVSDRNCLQVDAEVEVLGVTHAEIGMWLLKKWSLPPKIVYPVAYHHNFHPRRDFADRTAVVHLADILCRAKGVGFPGDQRIPQINKEAWALVRLTMEDVESVCAELDEDAVEGMAG